MKLTFKSNPSARLPIPCPHCGKNTDHLVSELRTNPEFTCQHCGGAVAIDGTQLDGFIKLFENFGR